MGPREWCKNALSKFFHYPRTQEPAYGSESQPQGRQAASGNAHTMDSLMPDRIHDSSAVPSAFESTPSNPRNSWIVPLAAQIARVVDTAKEHPLIEGPAESSPQPALPQTPVGEVGQAVPRCLYFSIDSIADRLSSTEHSPWGSSTTLRSGEEFGTFLSETMEKMGSIDDVKSAEEVLATQPPKSPSPCQTKISNTRPARHENPKLRLARLRREAESRSGSSANSLDSAAGALGDGRARSGASTPSPLSPPRSELGESGRAEENARMAPRTREEIFDLMGGVHCANLARTGLPRWGHEEVQRLRSEKLATVKAGKEKKVDTAARGARPCAGVEE